MAVVQVLAVNVLTDGLPALALARDPATPGAMLRPPRARGTFLPGDVMLALGVAGVLVGLVASPPSSWAGSSTRPRRRRWRS